MMANLSESTSDTAPPNDQRVHGVNGKHSENMTAIRGFPNIWNMCCSFSRSAFYHSFLKLPQELHPVLTASKSGWSHSWGDGWGRIALGSAPETICQSEWTLCTQKQNISEMFSSPNSGAKERLWLIQLVPITSKLKSIHPVPFKCMCLGKNYKT